MLFPSVTALDFYVRGDDKFNNQDYAGALADYTQAITLYARYDNAYYSRGLVRAAQGDR